MTKLDSRRFIAALPYVLLTGSVLGDRSSQRLQHCPYMHRTVTSTCDCSPHADRKVHLAESKPCTAAIPAFAQKSTTCIPPDERTAVMRTPIQQRASQTRSWRMRHAHPLQCPPTRSHARTNERTHARTYERTHARTPRCARTRAQARQVTLLGVAVNIGLTAGTGVVGHISGSSSLIAHAVHSLSDLASDAVALAALKLASSAPDKLHPCASTGLVVGMLVGWYS